MSWLVALLAYLCRRRAHAGRIAMARAVILSLHQLVRDKREVFSPRRLARYARSEILLQRLVRSLMVARMRMLKGGADRFDLLAFRLGRPAGRRETLARRLAGLHNTLVHIDRICRQLIRWSRLREARRLRDIAARRSRFGQGLLASASRRALAHALLARPPASPRVLDLSG